MGPRLLYSLIIGAAILASLVLRVWDPTPVARLRSLVFDSYQRLAPLKFDPELPVRIVDIDEESLQRIGQWPWPRTVLSDLLAKLRDAGAATVGFDMVFPEPDRMSPANAVKFWPQSDQLTQLKTELDALPSNDEIFGETIGTAPVVMGFIASPMNQHALPEAKAGISFGGDDPRLFAPHYPGATSSLKELQTPAVGAGALNWVPEYDQIIRRMPILVTLDETLYPSFSADLLRVAQGASTYVVKSSGASGEKAFGEQTGIVKVRVGDFEIPTDANGQMWLHFSPQTRDRYLPAWKILNGELGEEAIAGRILLIGTSAAGLLDLRATPLEASVPGVELHAQAVEQIIRGSYLMRPDFATPAELLYILVLGLLIAVLIYRAGALGSAVLGGLAVAFVVWLSWHAFNSWGWLVDPVYPTIALTAIYLTGSSFVFLRTERERNRVRNAFSHYMAPALVERLADDPERLKLGGENRDMTLLFSDVRGFTTISEGLDAEELTRFLNDLFTPLSNIILDEEGTIDKFMGDALMAFWNAPLDDPYHPGHACAAALRMVDEMAVLNERWQKAAEEAGREYKPVKLGIGLNTGVCCVGNLGSETRFDYSVIGDNVNVASRLEGQSKTYDLVIIVGEETAARAPDFAFLELDLLKVKGKTAATRIFGLLGDDAVRQSEAFGALAAKHQDFLSKYRAMDWDGAKVLLAECETLGGDKLKGLYALYRQRIDAFRITPPPDNWDGSTQAASK
ncbi:CHASE2 domain-containing protein [Methyloceanibacter caenitepidi]|uniref:Adenylate cyclase n=1 Tax=Methyloceanibacter caenitepidi TaxID=1384459 RepID=A0A0A8K4S4_9HYPH|nr:adenylate/guanylate cyclase domain-containing protein [Methyloceanibacter caenitepidi]BAQ17796.1 adenylate cyclase [Methyloceanibacter caenitepidi]